MEREDDSSSRGQSTAEGGVDERAASVEGASGPRYGDVVQSGRAEDDGTGTREGGAPRSDVATVERVIRRATKLQIARSGRNKAGEEGLTDTDILRIGEELGLDSVNVRQALLDVRADRARPKRKADKSLTTRLFGQRHVRGSRTINRPAEQVQRLLESHLADKECLAEVKRSSGASVWVPATGLATKIQRGLNLGRRAYILSKSQELTLSVAALDEETCLVTLTADIANLRRERAAGLSIGSAFVLMPTISILLAWPLGLPVELSILAGAGGAGTSAVSTTRVAVRNQRIQMQAAINGLLDRLEAGVPLEEPRASFQERFLK